MTVHAYGPDAPDEAEYCTAIGPRALRWGVEFIYHRRWTIMGTSYVCLDCGHVGRTRDEHVFFRVLD